MVMIPASIISILAITALIWLFNRFLPRRICAICAGVSATWLWLVGARLAGYSIDPLVPGVLMGGSVVGLAYQLESKLPPNRSALLWKTLFIPAGFLAAIYLLLFELLYLSLSLVVSAIILLLFFYDDGRRVRARHSGKHISELEREMDKCC